MVKVRIVCEKNLIPILSLHLFSGGPAIPELLPVPTLSLQSQAGEWALVCTGSPAFPGARFSLYRLGSTFPDATRSAPATRYRALFALSSLPAQDSPLSDQYQCQYSSLLGAEWSHSERSPLVAVPRAIGLHLSDVCVCLSLCASTHTTQEAALNYFSPIIMSVILFQKRPPPPLPPHQVTH